LALGARGKTPFEQDLLEQTLLSSFKTAKMADRTSVVQDSKWALSPCSEYSSEQSWTSLIPWEQRKHLWKWQEMKPKTQKPNADFKLTHRIMFQKPLIRL